MAKQLFSNNASALLAASISDSDLTIQVQNGFGQFYPNPGVGEYFLVTIENDEGDIEIAKITSRATDLLTVAVAGRGQEGTSAQAFTNGQARVECRVTEGTLETFIQRGGDAMSGDLDMDENDLKDAILTGSGTKMLAGEIVDVPIRGVSGDDSNELAVPTDGTRATAGGDPILTETDLEGVRSAAYEIGMIMMWFGEAVDCPDGWAICDGDDGTPDLRGLFVRGVSASIVLGATGGAVSDTADTTDAGAHDHDAETGDHVLTVDEMPTHDHSADSTITLPMSNDDNSQSPFTALEGSNQQLNGTASFNVTLTVGEAGGDEAHSHTIAAEPDHHHSVTIDTVPPYKALYYIMFIGF